MSVTSLTKFVDWGNNNATCNYNRLCDIPRISRIVWRWQMIHFIMFCFFIYGLYKFIDEWDDPEYNALCYGGREEYDKAKNSMTEKEFKQYVKEKSKLMQKAMNDAAEYYRKNKK